MGMDGLEEGSRVGMIVTIYLFTIGEITIDLSRRPAT